MGHFEESMALNKVLDFGFRDIKEFAEFSSETKPMFDDISYQMSKNGKFIAPRSIRFRENDLTNLQGLFDAFGRSIENFVGVQWLDLSFNEITGIDEHLSPLVSLKVLYLHGNRISNMKDIQNLAKLEQLAGLTLHANPVERKPNYRCQIIKLLPNLKKLDFVSITKQERREDRVRRC